MFLTIMNRMYVYFFNKYAMDIWSLIRLIRKYKKVIYFISYNTKLGIYIL